MKNNRQRNTTRKEKGTQKSGTENGNGIIIDNTRNRLFRKTAESKERRKEKEVIIPKELVIESEQHKAYEVNVQKLQHDLGFAISFHCWMFFVFKKPHKTPYHLISSSSSKKRTTSFI